MGKKKACRSVVEADLRKERSSYMHADLSDMKSGSGLGLGVEKLLPIGFPMQLFNQPTPAPKIVRVDSYRAPPLKMTLETIEEDRADYEKPEHFSRSKSLPVQRSFAVDSNGGLYSLPSYRRGQGGYLAGQGYRAGEGGCGVSMSGPILSNPNEFAPRKHRRPRISISRMREAIRHSRVREAFGHILSRMRPTSRRSH